MKYFVTILLLFLIEIPDVRAGEVLTPQEHRRGVEQTFLTFPEWFLVFSPEEYAAYIKDKEPSGFPFLRHVGQFWKSYAIVTKAIPEEYPANIGYHVMIWIIGVSTTLEYGLKSVYENTIGRLTEYTRTHGKTEEDIIAMEVAQDYADFINISPWYEYDFYDRLKEVWTNPHLWGRDAIRKWERKCILSLEYGFKAGYGWLIKKGTKMSYQVPLLETAMVVDRLPHGIKKELPEIKIHKTFSDGKVFITVPRYAAFTHYAMVLASQGVHFLEIAGNTESKPILVSIIVPDALQKVASGASLLFQQPILTQKSKKRIVLVASVGTLPEVLLHYKKAPFRLEHVFDY